MSSPKSGIAWPKPNRPSVRSSGTTASLRCYMEAERKPSRSQAPSGAALRLWNRFRNNALELIPEVLVVDLVVILNLRRLHHRAQQARAPVCRTLLQIQIPVLHLFAEERLRPLRVPEVVHRVVDVVRQEALRRTQIRNVRHLAVEPGFEYAVKNHIRIGVRRNRPNFDP